jgi:hypothetical protein
LNPPTIAFILFIAMPREIAARLNGSSFRMNDIGCSPMIHGNMFVLRASDFPRVRPVEQYK